MLRSQYSDEDNETIQRFLLAKKNLRQEEKVQQLNGRMVQEGTDQEGSSGKIIKFSIILLYSYFSAA